MAVVKRAIGGAGTGKTRQILDELSRAKDELNLSVDEIGFCTFTRAGRQEISERAAETWGVDVERLTSSGWFRTAHSISYRCCEIEDGQLLEGRNGDEWLSTAVGGKINSRIDSRGERTYVADGDDTIPLALKAWELCRSRMEPLSVTLDRWSRCQSSSVSYADAVHVIQRYEQAKRRGDRLDFTDMIARFAGVRYTIAGPEFVDPLGDVPMDLRVLAIDEAQDSSQLVDRVCRRLAASDRIERIWLTGDPYQSIHSFAGGDYRLFLAWDAIEETMPRSYRCPRQILALGERCLRQMTTGYRERGIQPAGHEGSIRSTSEIEDALSGLTASSSALILGRCTFSIEDYESELIRRGLPYCWVDKNHNASTLSGYGALWSLQHGEACRGADYANAVAMLTVNSKTHGELLARGEKAAWRDGRRGHVDIVLPTDRALAELGVTDVLRDMIRGGRWPEVVEPKSREKCERWFAVATRHGLEVANNPSIRLSTIHSAKGLEADKVILSASTSPSVERSRSILADLHDEECRVAYVAVTRARKDFVFVEDRYNYRMDLPL